MAGYFDLMKLGFDPEFQRLIQAKEDKKTLFEHAEGLDIEPAALEWKAAELRVDNWIAQQRALLGDTEVVPYGEATEEIVRVATEAKKKLAEKKEAEREKSHAAHVDALSRAKAKAI